MPIDRLEAEYKEFRQEILLEAQSSAELQATVFFNTYGAVAAENGDCGDLECAHVHKEGSNGYQLDGFLLDRDRQELVLVVSDFRSSVELQTLNRTALEALFRRSERFLDNSLKSGFVSKLEETSDDFQVAHLIKESERDIEQVKIIVFSNARLVARNREVETRRRNNRLVSYGVLDFSRYVDIIESKTGHEEIDIDVEQLLGEAIPCIKAYSDGKDYESYLAAIPGSFVADIYSKFGARLLEQNVRTFLQARTKVNQGIINTLNDRPDMFFAYNNGLTATASSIRTTLLSGNGLGLAAVTNLQIVNGGQTTASILYARDRRNVDLSSVYVQMKLSIVKSEIVEDVVSKISRFANSQNRISEADFFASHPFHIEMEKISRRLTAPPKEGSLHGSRWFYERARGQYRDEQAYMRKSERARFQLQYPKEQLLLKTDVAKYELAFECKPHVVCLGAQKAFLSFADTISKRWEKNARQLGEGYFKNLVSMAIIFRWTDRMIGVSGWYRTDRGYKAQVVAYTVAWVVHVIRNELEKKIDLRHIWMCQSVPPPLASLISNAAPNVAQIVKDAPESVRNISEYAKNVACWEAVKSKVRLQVPHELDSCLIDHNSEKEIQLDDRKEQKIVNELELEVLLYELAPQIGLIRSAAARNEFLTANGIRAMDKISSGQLYLTRTEKKAMQETLSKLSEVGVEFSVSKT